MVVIRSSPHHFQSAEVVPTLNVFHGQQWTTKDKITD